MELAPGTLLQEGKYKIIEKLGQGGFGIAYRAHDQSLKRDVCIKEFFYSDLCERAQNALDVTIITKSVEKLSLVNSFKKKFTKEAQRLAKFQHPNIVQVMDTFEENNTAYFVMEYLDGGSLEDLIHRNGSMSEEKVKQFILPIINAMDTVHKKDLLHLDIKPANIMLRKNQSPVLIDFGISKYLENSSGIENTKTTSPVGISKGYAPLEQYSGGISSFSKATDVYSICATLYKMVTGITPPEPLQMQSSGFKSLQDIRPKISIQFIAALVKGLATDSTKRHQSMSQLKTALEESTKASQTGKQSVAKTTKTALPTAAEYIQLAEWEWKNKEWRKASEHYTGAIINDEKNDKYYCLRAKCYSEMGDQNKAIDDYSTAIKLNDNNHEATNNRGVCYSRLDYFKAAQEDFYKAYSISKQDIYFNNWINTIERTSDISALNKFLSEHSNKSINSNNKKSLYFLRGELHLNARERDKALEDFAIAKQIGGYFDWHQEELLRSLSWKSPEILNRFIVLIISNVVVLFTSIYMCINGIGFLEDSTWHTPIPFLLILSICTSFYLSWTPGDEWATLHGYTSANFQLIEKSVFQLFMFTPHLLSYSLNISNGILI